LRKTLRRGGVAKADIERFIAWAESDDPLTRTARLSRAMDLVARARKRLGTVVAFEQTIRRVLSGSPEAFLRWADGFGPAFESLLAMDPGFHALKIKQALIERIAKWVAESGEIDPDRLANIWSLLHFLERGTYSATAAERLVKELLETTVAVAHC
jgi:GNAT superfamily N-acetyltransferase